MIVKGIQGGKNRGTPIEFTPEEKPKVMIKNHIPTLHKEGEVWWPERIKILKSEIISRGKTPKGFQGNSYMAEGSFCLRRLVVKTDKVFDPSAPKKFRIIFKDTEDSNGMPHMEVVEFKCDSL